MWLIFVCGIMLTTLCVMARPASGATPLAVEAEKMSGAGVPFKDRTASNYAARLLDRNGGLSKAIEGSVGGLTVRARGEGCNGAPRMLVQLDGRIVMSRLVETQRRWSSYRTGVRVTGERHKLLISFTNDRSAQTCDRDLRIDRATLEIGSAVAKPTCSERLQDSIDAAAPGAVVEVSGGCIHRETVNISKPLTLRGEPGAEIRGSDVWPSSEFRRTEEGLYKSTKTLPVLEADTSALCEGSSKICHQPEQVYLDGVALEQVANAAAPVSGEFKVDPDRYVYLADNPSGKTVEVTTRDTWIAGSANVVTISNIVFKHAAANGMKPVGDGWTVQGCDLSYAHQANLRMSQGAGYVVRGNRLHHGGQMGIGGNESSVQIVSNDVYANNTERYATSWAAGGMKLTNARTLVIEGNHVHHNEGNGIWTDVPSMPQDITISNNRVDHNDNHGIRFEVSTNGSIFGNEVWENGWDGGGYGISLNASSDAKVHHNTVAWNQSGIRVHNPIRTDVHKDEAAYNTVSNVEVYANLIFQEQAPGSLALGWVVPDANPYANLFDAAANNRGHDNRYYYSGPEGSALYRFAWDGHYAKMSDFNGTVGEESGRYISPTQKQQALESARVAASPAPR
jgi:parallel beta-helix repeat protein